MNYNYNNCINYNGDYFVIIKDQGLFKLFNIDENDIKDAIKSLYAGEKKPEK